MHSLRVTSFMILLFLFGISVLPAHANTITVNSLADTATAGDGACTLREAIAVANADTVGHADCGTGSGADTITLNVTGQINVNNLMSVTASSTIIINEGAGDVVLNGVNSRIFVLFGNLTINGLTLQNGFSGSSGGCISTNINVSLTINDSTLQNCNSGGFGGAINTGTGANVTISNSTFANNRATVGGAIYMSGTLSISGSTFTMNTTSGTTGSGGAIYVEVAGNSSITNTLFDQNTGTGNSSPSSGGALAAEIGSFPLSISGSTFSNNQVNGGGRAGQGGAIYTRFGALTVSDSVFTGNQALGTDALGGAIYTSFTSITVTSSRLQSNTATGTGDAFYSNVGTSAITGSCIVNNGDTAVVNNFGGTTNATGNWWGSSWGPRIPELGSTAGSTYSTGDSINGNGTASVNVGLTSAGDGDTAPTGNWLTSAPTVAGTSCEMHPSATTGAGLNVTVPFQGRPPAPNARLIVQLTVILKPTAGGEAVINTTLSTNQNGMLPTLTAPAGSYTLWVKGAHTLARSQPVTLAVGSNPLTLSILLEGDSNNDNQIVLTDFSMLATAFGTSVGDPTYNPATDFNGDNNISLPDFSLLASNFGVAGAAAP